MKCCACLKEIDLNEYLENGGLCKECSIAIDEIYKKEGEIGARRYFAQKRKEKKGL